MNNKQNNTNNKFGRVLAVPTLCELYPGICLTTEEKARKNFSHGIRKKNCASSWSFTRILFVYNILHENKKKEPNKCQEFNKMLKYLN
jgi:hypothetical protein